MKVSIKERDELIRTVNHPDNKTGSAHIPVAIYKTKEDTYYFAIMCQKKMSIKDIEERKKKGKQKILK